jgi:Aspartyl/Asparaginyl beta-hydroxylase
MSRVPDRLRLGLDFDPAPLVADMDALDAGEWVPHFNTRLYTGEWSGVALRSVGGKPGTLYPEHTANVDYADTPALGACPAIRNALDRFACPLTAVRLLRLAPGAAVGEHRDYKLGHADGELRIHVPLTTNPDVEFVHCGERVEMAPGQSWYLNFSEPHSVANRGGTARVHLLVDCVVNPWLDEQLAVAAA